MKNRSLVLLSGEGTTIPAAEAKALFLADDPESGFESPEPRLLVAESSADPLKVGARIAYARRVGRLVEDRGELAGMLKGHRVRFRSFDLGAEKPAADPGEYLAGLGVTIDLQRPERELTLVRGEADWLAVTAPLSMDQGWSGRRPRRRPFFHPSAIFPKLSRALVNLSRCGPGQVFLEPFAGTGSIALEAYRVGASVVAVDMAERMVRGAVRNMEHFGQRWLGGIRADSARLPLATADAVATDMPYGRASSTAGRAPEEMLRVLLPAFAEVLTRHSHMVLMHPREAEVPRSREFALLEEHHLHVHKLLTRTISVLERR